MNEPAPSSALPLIRRPRNLALTVVDVLADRIRDGRLAPGAKLATESALMAEFGVSRTVIREALSKLQAAALVQTRHGIGTFVSPTGSDSAVFRIRADHPPDRSAELSLADGLDPGRKPDHCEDEQHEKQRAHRHDLRQRAHELAEPRHAIELTRPAASGLAGELDEIAWVEFQEAMALDLPNITRFVLHEVGQRLAETGRPAPFMRFLNGKRHLTLL